MLIAKNNGTNNNKQLAYVAGGTTSLLGSAADFVWSSGKSPSDMGGIQLELSSAGYVLSLDKNNDGDFDDVTTGDYVTGTLPYNGAATSISNIRISGNGRVGSDATATGVYFDDFLVTGFPDTTSPAVSALSPADNAANASAAANLSITFDELVYAQVGGTISLYESAGGTLVESFDVTTDAAVSGATVTVVTTKKTPRSKWSSGPTT